MVKAWASDVISVRGKTISITYVFAPSALYPSPKKPHREFRESDLKAEWENFLKYLMKRKAPIEKIRNPQIYDELKKYALAFKVRLHSYPDFKFFKKSVRFFLAESLKIFLSQTPEVVKGNRLSLQIKIIKAGRLDNLLPDLDGALIGTLCTYEQAFLEISGEYLMDVVVGPLFMLRELKKDKTIELPTNVFHELQHQIGLKSVQFYDKVFDAKWEEISLKDLKRYPGVPRRSGGAAILIATAYGIEAEALSMFRETRNLKEIPIIPKYAQKFREKLEELAEIIDAEEAKSYFEEKVDIDWGTGTYYWSLVMPLTIALAIAKKENKWEIFLRNKKNEQFHFYKFADLLKQGDVFYVPKLPDKLFKMTMQYVYDKTYIWRDKKGKIYLDPKGVPMSPVLRFKKFILLYEEACATLGVRKQDMVFTWSYFYDLYRYARMHYKKKYKKLVEDAGFIYEDLGTAYY